MLLAGNNPFGEACLAHVLYCVQINMFGIAGSGTKKVRLCEQFHGMHVVLVEFSRGCSFEFSMTQAITVVTF